MILMEKNSKDWLIHYKGNEVLAERFDDQINAHLRTQRTILTPFLDETQQEVLKRVAGNRVSLSFWGGYEDAERKRALISEYEDDFDLVQLKAKLHGFEKISHSDCMGALYNLGCRNDHFGDILVQEDAVVVFVCRSIASFVMQNCTKIRRSSVAFIESDEPVIRDVQLKKISKILSSTRLDALVSACTHLSRDKAQQLIRSKNVKVNHVCLDETSFLCHNDSILSIRGYGRFIYKGVVKETKNGKKVVEIQAYK